LSQYHFARAFKQATGHTVHQYLTTVRLERAKELLAANEFSIADIAFRCSFSSQANFTKTFVRSLGISPGRYRRACACSVFPRAAGCCTGSPGLGADSGTEMLRYPIPAV
jgi:transcriptional regulator GlxA family with amidase domain